jgi:cytochrome b6-f complex iron-sulfur subunit
MVAAAWPVLRGLSGCSGEGEEAPPSLTIPLAELPDGARQRHLLGTVPVEVRREGDRITARSLLCTHQGCEVVWEEADRRYVCPCHDGTFDADGQVTGGPPTRPLGEFSVQKRDALVIIEG